MNQSSTKSNCLGFRNNVVSTRNQPIVNSNQPVGFLEFNDNRQQIIKFDNTFNYNPVSKILTVQNINATTNHASSITITNDTTSNSTFYLTFVDNDGVEKNLKINKSGISYNPSTNLLTLTGALTSNSIITGGITCSGILMDGNLTGDGTNNMTSWNTITCNTITANFLVGNGSLLTNVFANFSGKTDKILTATTSLDINFNLLFQPSVLAVDGYESVLFNSGITFNPSSKILKLSQTASYLQAHGANNVFGYFGGGNANPGTGTTNPWIATISGGNNTIGQAIFGWLFYNSSSNGDLTINRRNGTTTDVNVMTFVRNNGNCGVGVIAPLEKLVSSGTVRALGGTISNEPSATMSYNPTAGFWPYAGTMALESRGINSSVLGAMAFAIATSTFSSHIIAMYIKQNGYVGIGTTTPEVKLHVSAGDIGIDRSSKFSFGAGYSSAWFIEQNSADNFLQITRKGEALGPSMTFKTNNNVGIGSTNPVYRLQVQGSLFATSYYIEATGGGGGVVSTWLNDAHGGAFNNHWFLGGALKYYFTQNGAFIQVSDNKFKSNQKNMENCLDKMMLLTPKTYTMGDNDNLIGFIAQEVNEIFDNVAIPPCKSDLEGCEEIPWTMNYQSLFVYNIKATQELNLKVEELTRDNETMKKENENIKIENENMKKEIVDLNLKYESLLTRLILLEAK